MVIPRPPPLLLLLLSCSAAAAPPSSCSCLGGGGGHGVAGAGSSSSSYGSVCGRWDAPDEAPWCRVATAAAACGADVTYESNGHFWSHEPCGGEGLAYDPLILPGGAAADASAEQRQAWGFGAGSAGATALAAATGGGPGGYSDGFDVSPAAFGQAEGVLKWVSRWDANGDALLCNAEVRAMPPAVREWLPRYDRLTAAGAPPMCLRFNMVEAALFKLPAAALARVAAAHSDDAWHVDDTRAYKFQEVPDFQRRCQWPYMSQAGADAAVTWVYHGEGLPWRWSPADVRTGDIISVRGEGVSAHFWANVHPRITQKYILLVQTEAEDATPGAFAARAAADANLGVFYMLNHDEQHVGFSPKFKPLALGQVLLLLANSLLATD